MNDTLRLSWARGQALRVIEESSSARMHLQVVALEPALSWEVRLTATALLKRLDEAIDALRSTLGHEDANAVLKCSVETTKERRHAEDHLRAVMGPGPLGDRPPRIPPILARV